MIEQRKQDDSQAKREDTLFDMQSVEYTLDASPQAEETTGAVETTAPENEAQDAAMLPLMFKISRQYQPISFTGFGMVLAEMRKQCDISVEDLAQVTKIKGEYIRFMESEDFAKLPKFGVYTMAYLRCIAQNMHATPEEIEYLTNELKKRCDDSPDTHPCVKVSDIVVDSGEIKRQKQLAFVLLAGTALITLLLISAIAFLVVHIRNSSDRQEMFDRTQLMEIQPVPNIDNAVLPVVAAPVPQPNAGKPLAPAQRRGTR